MNYCDDKFREKSGCSRDRMLKIKEMDFYESR